MDHSAKHGSLSEMRFGSSPSGERRGEKEKSSGRKAGLCEAALECAVGDVSEIVNGRNMPETSEAESMSGMEERWRRLLLWGNRALLYPEAGGGVTKRERQQLQGVLEGEAGGF